MKNLLLLVTALMLMISTVVVADDMDIDESSVATFASKRAMGQPVAVVGVESYGQKLIGKEAWVGMDQDITIKAKANKDSYIYAFSVDSNNKLTVHFAAKNVKANKEATKNLKVKQTKATYYIIATTKKDSALDSIAKKANQTISAGDIKKLNDKASDKNQQKVTLRTE